MNGIPEATPIRLTEEERAELLSLARSTKTEYRMRQRAQIVLLAAEGMASRAIGREVGCTTGTASKWRGGEERDRRGRRCGSAMRATAWPGWTRPATAAPNPNTRWRPTSAFWRYSTDRCRRPGTAAGAVR